MAWPTQGTVTKAATNGGAWSFTDMNNLQYQFCRATGILNTDLDPTTVLQPVGLNETTDVHRGKFIQSGSSFETITSTSYADMTTPDRVQNIVLPTDGLIDIYYHAEWSSSVSNVGKAAIFLGSNQLKKPTSTGGTSVQEVTSAASNIESPVVTCSAGLVAAVNSVDYGGPVTTGQVIGDNNGIGGACTVFAAAGTYTVGIKYKSSSGTVQRRYGKLWVVARSF